MAVESGGIPGVSVDLDSLLAIQQRLTGLSLGSFKHFSASRSGSRQSRLLGRGMEYEESRAYVVGDDIKAMDWRVMARTGEAHTKVFSEQRDRMIKIAIDFSPSMFFGTKNAFKSWAAAQIAGHLGWLATIGDDRLGGLVVSIDGLHNGRSRKSRDGLMSLFQRICEGCDQELPVSPGQGRLNLMLGELQRSARHGSVVVLISDFIAVDDLTGALLQRISRHQEVVMCWIHDRTEVEPWQTGSYPIKLDGEDAEVDTRTNAGARWLQDQQRAHRERVMALASQFRLPLMEMSCNEDITSQLTRYLGNRL